MAGHRGSSNFDEEASVADTASHVSLGATSTHSARQRGLNSGITLPVRSRSTNPTASGAADGFSSPLGGSGVGSGGSGPSIVAFSQDSRDIREGSYRLGSLALSDGLPPSVTKSARRPSNHNHQVHRKVSQQQVADASFGAIDPASLQSPSNTPSALAQLLQSKQVSPEFDVVTPKVSSLSLPESPLDDDPSSPQSSSGDTLKRARSTEPLPEDLAEDAEDDVQNKQKPQRDVLAEPGAPLQGSLAMLRPLLHPSRATENERDPLLPKIATESAPAAGVRRLPDFSTIKQQFSSKWASLKQARPPKISLWSALAAPLPYLPSTLLGILMNLLDGVSYGLIMFPKTPHFLSFGGISVSMFFISCIVSQLVYSTFSIFKAGNGSMMIEIVPFLHSLVFDISQRVAPERVVPTCMAAFALSSIATGSVFLVLGLLRSGRLLEFFPRHVLCGCIGGIGAFLVITGLQVTARLDESNAPDLNFQTIRAFLTMPLLPLWTIPLALALLLREIAKRFQHPLVMPGFFALVTFFFYIFGFFAFHKDLKQLQQLGWVFEMSAEDAQEPFYEFWGKFSFKNTDFTALIATMPTQAALVFFAILHVPLNVPALALSLSEDNVSTDKELLNHGISNILAGLVGTIPNYLCYTNSVLFYRVGGDTRLSGFMLAVATAAVMVVGPQIIGLLPVMVVGTLIYLLGIDLMKEALVDTLGRVSKFEYATILAIVLVMTFVDFVVGVGVGILLACVSFVIISSRRASVRQILSGKAARSTVRRHPYQARFLEQVGSQIRVIKLQGAVFFGTASGCEATIRQLLEEAQWTAQPIRYMIIDMHRCSSVDYSASEAFLRILRTCQTRQVVLVFCGLTPTSAVGQALRGVGLWPGMQDDARLEVFETLNGALEACENWQLRALYSHDLEPPDTSGIAEGLTIGVDNTLPASAQQSPSAFGFSPRRSAMFAAAQTALGDVYHGPNPDDSAISETHQQQHQPMQILKSALSAFAPEMTESRTFYRKIAPFFERMSVEAGTILWNMEDESNSFYVIESGVLRANRDMQDLHFCSVETMLPATVCGVLSFLSGWPHSSKLVVERDAVLWRLDVEAFLNMEKSLSEDQLVTLRQIWARLVQYQQDLVLSHLATTL